MGSVRLRRWRISPHAGTSAHLVKRPFAFLSVSLLVSALPSFATSGGGSSVGGFCLEPGGRRILYVASEGGEGGCTDALHALDVGSGRSTLLLGCSADEKRRQKLLQGCTPLSATSPSALGLVTTLVSRGGATTFTDLPDDPGLWFPQRLTYPQRLELRRDGALVGALDFSTCLYTSHPKVAWLTLFVVPKKPFGVLTVTHLGTCIESGYLKDDLLLSPRLFEAKGAPPPRQNPRPDPVVLKPPDVEFSEEYLKAAKQLERANKLAAAAHYREAADEHRRFEVARALEAACLDPDSGRLHTRGMAFELEPGTTTSLSACRTSACNARPVNCAPLQSEWLSALGIAASVRSAGKPQVPAPGGRQGDFIVQCPQALVLARNGAPLAVHPFSSACPSDTPVRLDAWPVPQKQLTVFRLTGTMKDGHQGSTEFFTIAMKGLKPSRRKVLTEAEHWLLLDLPPVDRAELLNDAGMALYRQERFEEAAGSFGQAWAETWNRQPRLFIALFNQAAALARGGHVDQSLGLLRQLLSFSTERKRFVANVATDDAFAELRTDARLTSLLAEPDCCLETISQKTPEWTSVVRWKNGEPVLLHRVELRHGAKVGEFDAEAGFARSWNEAGKLRSEELLAGGEKSGPSRRWDDAGNLLSETMYVEGLKSGLEREWSSTGQLISETTYEAGAMTGRRRTWFPTGMPKSDSQLVEGRVTGPSRTWYESGQLETEAIVDGDDRAKPDGGAETVHFRRWSASGQLLGESWTIGGLWHGTWREWSESGQLTSETRFEKGVRRGETRTWTDDGGVSPR